MAANDKITLPTETGNTGTKLAVVTRTQGADTVAINRMVPTREAVVKGVYRCATAVTTMAVAAQNGTSTALFWFTNPAASGRTVRLRRISLQYNFIGVTTLTTLPRMLLARVTWTGTPSGAQLAAVNVDASSVVASIADIRTASTGMTVSLTANTQLVSDLVPIAQVAGTAAVFETTPTIRSEMIDAESAEDEWIVIPPGQGVVLYQADAGGATTETRRVLANLVWDEIDLSG